MGGYTVQDPPGPLMVHEYDVQCLGPCTMTRREGLKTPSKARLG